MYRLTRPTGHIVAAYAIYALAGFLLYATQLLLVSALAHFIGFSAWLVGTGWAALIAAFGALTAVLARHVRFQLAPTLYPDDAAGRRRIIWLGGIPLAVTPLVSAMAWMAANGAAGRSLTAIAGAGQPYATSATWGLLGTVAGCLATAIYIAAASTIKPPVITGQD